jgi:hypothetical protein
VAWPLAFTLATMLSARRVDSEPVLRALELICKMFMVLLLYWVGAAMGLLYSFQYRRKSR